MAVALQRQKDDNTNEVDQASMTSAERAKTQKHQRRTQEFKAFADNHPEIEGAWETDASDIKKPTKNTGPKKGVAADFDKVN